jgi:hypothetical protein
LWRLLAKRSDISGQQFASRGKKKPPPNRRHLHGWIPHNAGFGFLDLAPSILHSNWFWDYIS